MSRIRCRNCCDIHVSEDRGRCENQEESCVSYGPNDTTVVPNIAWWYHGHLGLHVSTL